LLGGLFDAALDLKIEFFLVKASARQVFLQLLELFPDAFTDVQIAQLAFEFAQIASKRLPSGSKPRLAIVLPSVAETDCFFPPR